MLPTYSQDHLLDEKAALTSTQALPPQHRVPKRMPSTRRFFITLLFGLLVTAGLANAFLKQEPIGEDAAESEDDHVVHRDDSTFSRLLSSASPQALHSFLHTYFPSTYQHGVYDSDHAAMEAVHANDPELATSIVQMAKRQSGNETTASTIVSSTTTDSGGLTISSTTSETSTTEETTPPASTSSTETTTTQAETSTATTTSTTQQSSSDTMTSTSESSEVISTPASTLSTTTTSGPTTTRPPRTSTFTSTLPGGAQVCRKTNFLFPPFRCLPPQFRVIPTTLDTRAFETEFA
ncbi:uncharacterized protein GGS25DRAFT_490382 [Hypoxylon fragiforme]|uniref:uncharacterized protein n=1 Tax=Hypoxylon fragiforme TaxID=63214 RepID=UPI0020C7122F|nr:uncharacterized protein GGS25DRAFT_490382 [Hypoxylon fragiforme]KAI2608453.1 hypothetical protein GGS25DRAFT_490382 [Hypoxylon fragiforme]